MTARQEHEELARCRLCRALGEGCGADRLQGEALPPEAQQLVGMPNDQTWDEELIVLCPRCLTPYRYTCSAGYGEHTVSLDRATLPEARGLVGEPTYQALIDRLPGTLDHPDRAVQTFAARSLTDHHLRAGNAEAVLALLRHPSGNVCIQSTVTLMACAEHLQPYVPTFIGLLTDSRPNVRINAIRAFTVHKEDRKDTIRWGGAPLLQAVAEGSLHDHGYAFGKMVKVAANEGIDVSEFVPKLVELLGGNQPLAPYAAAEALLHLARTGRVGVEALQSMIAGVPGRDAQLLRLELDREGRPR